MKQKVGSLKKTNKVEEHFTRLMKQREREKEKNYVNNIRNGGDITAEIKRFKEM